MGLFSKLLLAPVAPVAGVIWLAERLEEQAAAVYYSPETVVAELESLREARDRSLISDEAFDRAEAALLVRLVEGPGG